MAESFQPGQQVKYLRFEAYTFRPYPAEVVKVTDKRVTIRVDGKLRSVKPVNLVAVKE